MLCYKPESEDSMAARYGGRQSQSMATMPHFPAQRRGVSA